MEQATAKEDAARAEMAAAYRTVSIDERQARHDEIAARKADSMAERRRIGQAYLEANPDGTVVPPDRAVAFLDLTDESRAAREEADRLNQGRDTKINNGALEFPVLAHEFDPAGPVIEFGTSPLIMAPVVRYLGMMPILFNLFVTRAHTTEFLPNTAHRFHLDPEDVRSFKVFVHLTDVDDECGPFHALPADLSAKVLEAVDYRGVTMLDDERVADLAGWDSVVKVTGPAGTVALADTTRCLHFGGRPRSAGKPLREMIVYQYLLPTSILLSGDSAIEARRFLPQLAATGDEAWDALTGFTLT